MNCRYVALLITMCAHAMAYMPQLLRRSRGLSLRYFKQETIGVVGSKGHQLIDSMPMYTATLGIISKYGLDTTEGRQQFLEDLVVDNKRVDYNDALLCFAMSVKDGGARSPWTFGVYDSILSSLTKGDYSANGDPPALKFIADLKEAESLLLNADDDLALRLIILSVREKIDDESYAEHAVPFQFTFGCESENITEGVDKERREELFCTLALLRFVRQGLGI